MTKEEAVRTTIEILGKSYQIKCRENDIDSLQEAALYLEDKMRALRDSGTVLSIDRIAVITALNITHQYLTLENQSNHQLQTVQQRLNDIHEKMNLSLSAPAPAQAESIFAE